MRSKAIRIPFYLIVPPAWNDDQREAIPGGEFTFQYISFPYPFQRGVGVACFFEVMMSLLVRWKRDDLCKPFYQEERQTWYSKASLREGRYTSNSKWRPVSGLMIPDSLRALTITSSSYCYLHSFSDGILKMHESQ